jgi:hypothetical protein
MLSADPLPQSRRRLDGADNATGFGIKPRYSHHLLVTLDRNSLRRGYCSSSRWVLKKKLGVIPLDTLRMQTTLVVPAIGMGLLAGTQ